MEYIPITEEKYPQKYDICHWNDSVFKLPIGKKMGKVFVDISKEVQNEMYDDRDIKMIIENSKLSVISELLTQYITKHLWDTGAFAKMHRAPTDSGWCGEMDETLEYLRCFSGNDVLVRFLKSKRISDDFQKYMKLGSKMFIYLMPFSEPDSKHEFRIFIDENKIISIRQHPFANTEPHFPEEQIKEISNRIYKLFSDYSRCVIDFEAVLAESSPGFEEEPFRLIKIAPFDTNTDFYE